MEKRELRKNATDMIYLTACAINGEVPKSGWTAGLDLPKLFEVCQQHILTACAAYALESAGIRDSEFIQAKEKAVRKNVLLDAERGTILRHLEAEGIWYMPLKGALLHHWYPKLGMRQMSDNDILCDSTKMAEVRDIFLENGYTCESFEQGNDDVYFKEPVFNFEMHRSLFHSRHIGGLYDYFKDIKERLIPDEGSEYGYHFSDEDFYIFMVAHEFKHFSTGGTGVRSLVDTYVFMNVYAELLDWDYLNVELEKLGIADFERSNRELAVKLFSKQKLTSEDKKLLDYYVMSGVYGTSSNALKHGIELRGNGSKLGYLKHRLFPSLNFLECSFPWVKKSRLLIPAAYGYRFIRGATVKRKKITNELIQLVRSK